MNVSEKLTKAMNNIFKFTIIDDDGKNKVQAPQMDLPKSVRERIKFFGKYAEDGLSFLGCINLILAEDEEQCKKDFEIGAYEEYLPATEEFKQWRDEPSLHSLHQMEIAVALMYGIGEEQGEE
jgi:hypothetical protein|nr:MAG TPA: hypothetical protein [Caudoviricetes sp.]